MGQFLDAIGCQPMQLWPVLVKLLLASVFGAALGTERTRKGRAAGIRTYSMVCLGSTLVMMTGVSLFERFGAGDPARLGAQVVSGIGFIGAGAIIVTGYHEIKGLTTAAGLWAAACVGLAVGAGYYLAAVVAVFILFLILILGARLQERVVRSTNYMRLLVYFTAPEYVAQFMLYGKENGIEVHDGENISEPGGAETGMVFSIKVPPHMPYERVVEVLLDAPGVHFIERL